MKRFAACLLALILAFSSASALAERGQVIDKPYIKRAQQALNDAGYNCGTPDGIAGKNTAAAVSAYQEAVGLEVTGVIDEALLAKLKVIGNEITFQGIPWGSSVEEVKKLLIDGGYVPWSLSSQLEDLDLIQGGGYMTWQEDVVVLPNRVDTEKGYDKVLYSLLLLDGYYVRTIAGYSVEAVLLCFVRDGEETHFVNVEIYLKMDNYATGKADLMQKLDTVYGEHCHVNYYDTIEANTWRGLNETIIVIDSTVEIDDFIFCYGQVIDEADLEKALENYVEPENDVDTDDTSGL